jgi:hypothetical protein
MLTGNLPWDSTDKVAKQPGTHSAESSSYQIKDSKKTQQWAAYLLVESADVQQEEDGDDNDAGTVKVVPGAVEVVLLVRRHLLRFIGSLRMDWLVTFQHVYTRWFVRYATSNYCSHLCSKLAGRTAW